ncbi:MAG: PIN domain-containing protein [Acidimicrobiia bacterium]|nr:PIN domain-containing protein [Acidimicrobiia bacterium]
MSRVVDANILIYSVDTSSPFHERADAWLSEALNGTRRVGLPWTSLHAFLRIVTNPRTARHPLAPAEAWEHVDGWLDAPAAWVPQPGRGHRAILEDLIVRLDLRSGLVADAALAAMCIEHGVAIVSADSDFARFTDLTWINPVA